MPTVQLESGQQVEFEKTPTPEDIDHVVAQTGNAQADNTQQGSGNPIRDRMTALSNSLALTGPDANDGSPLTLIDSIKYGLADDTGKQKLLSDKFNVVRQTDDGNYLVGDNPNDMSLVNPKGIFNDIPTKLAQHIGDINTITMSIAGATVGSAAGPGGAIGGSALGGAAGTAINKSIAKALGLNTQTPEAIATDIAIDGALMGVGEGVGQAINIGLKAAGRQIASKGMLMAEKFVKDGALPVAEQAKKAVGIADILHFTSGVNKEDVLTVIANGARKTLNKDTTGPLTGMVKGSEPHALKVIDMMQGAVKTEETRLGSQLGGAERRFFSEVSGTHIEATPDIQMNIMKQLENLKLGKIVTTETAGGESIVTFQVAPKLDTESKKILETWSGHFDAFGGKVYKNAEKINARGDVVPVTGKEVSGLELNLEGKVDMDLLASRSASVERDIQAASKSGKGKEETALISLKHGNIDPQFGAEVKGIDDTIARVASNSKNGAEYLVAKKEFGVFKSAVESLKKAGLDIENAVNTFHILDRADKINPVLRQAMGALDANMGTSFGNDIAMWKAANAMQKADVNYLRFGLVMSLTGLAALKQDSLPGKLGYAAAGLALATPRGSGEILKIRERMGVGAAGKTAIKTGMSKVGQVANSALLRRLISQTTAKNVATGLKKQTQ